MLDMCCKLMDSNTYSDKFKTSCTLQIRELCGELHEDLLKYDPDFLAFWDIIEGLRKAKPYLEYRP